MREMRRDGERGGVGWEEDGEGRCVRGHLREGVPGLVRVGVRAR